MAEKIKVAPGFRFGDITVIEKSDQRKGSSIVWKCTCDCGNTVFIDTQKIKRGVVTDCGCKTKTTKGARNLAGLRFGKLVALEATDKRMDQGSVVWKCICDCGKTAEVSARRLTRGKTKSCGCLSSPSEKDYIGRRFGRLTVTAFEGKIGRKNGQNYWKCICDCGKETTVGQTELQNGTTKSCGCYLKDVMRNNLKLVDGTSVTIIERVKNSKPRKSNKSGYTGVVQDKTGNWVAYINFKKKRYWLGRYNNKSDAIKARKQGEAIFDDFLNSYYSENQKSDK